MSENEFNERLENPDEIISELKRQNEELRQENADLKADLSYAKADINRLKAEVAEQNTAIDRTLEYFRKREERGLRG